MITMRNKQIQKFTQNIRLNKNSRKFQSGRKIQNNMKANKIK